MVCVMISLIISWSMCIDVDAAVLLSERLEICESDIDYDNFDITYEDLDVIEVTALDRYGDGSEGYESYFLLLTSEIPFLNTEKSVFAYEITFSGNGSGYIFDGIEWYVPVIGTHSEICSGNVYYGNTGSCWNGVESTIWYPNNYAEQELCIGILAYCHEYYNGSQVSPSIYYSTDFSFTVNTYVDADNSSEMEFGIEQSIEQTIRNQDILNEQTNMLEQQSAKLDAQTVLEEKQLEEEKEQTETSKGILSAITDFFGSFFDNLIDSVIGIFVPSGEELSELFERLNQFFSDTFGFLYFPFEFFIELAQTFIDSRNSNTSLTFPGFSIMGYQVWSDIAYDFTDNEVAMNVVHYVQIVTSIILSVFLVMYLKDFFDKRFGGGGS